MNINIQGYEFRSGDDVIVDMSSGYKIIGKLSFRDKDAIRYNGLVDHYNDYTYIYVSHDDIKYDSGNSEFAREYQSYGHAYGFKIAIGKLSIHNNVNSIFPRVSQYRVSAIDDSLLRFIKAHIPMYLPMFLVDLKPFEGFYSMKCSDRDGFVTISNGKKSVDIKISRFIKQLGESFNEKSELNRMDVSDKKIEVIYNKYISFQKQGLFDIKILSGDNIDIGYSSDSYAFYGGGTLHKSCMSNKFEFINIYKKNPNQISLAIMCVDDKIVSRCLIWKSVSGKSYYDRIYYSQDWVQEMMSTRLESMGYNSIKDVVDVVQLENWDFEFYPYIDSFFNFNKSSGRLLCLKEDNLRYLSSNGNVCSY